MKIWSSFDRISAHEAEAILPFPEVDVCVAPGVLQ